MLAIIRRGERQTPTTEAVDFGVKPVERFWRLGGYQRSKSEGRMLLPALIGTQSSDPPIEAPREESVSYVPTHWPIRQTNPEKSAGGACSSRFFAAQRDGDCPKRERSGNAGSDGTNQAPRDPVLLGSPESGVRTRARVVYCQRIENNRFAVGLELLPR
jgi:hypothetical protein